MTTEERKGKTPRGGVCSVITYFDANGRLIDKAEATQCKIEEYDENGNSLGRTYGQMASKGGGDSKRS